MPQISTDARPVILKNKKKGNRKLVSAGNRMTAQERKTYNKNFDRIFGRGKRDEADRITHWCNACRSPLRKSEVVLDRLACELCGFSGVQDYDYQDLSPEEKLYLH